MPLCTFSQRTVCLENSDAHRRLCSILFVSCLMFFGEDVPCFHPSLVGGNGHSSDSFCYTAGTQRPGTGLFPRPSG